MEGTETGWGRPAEPAPRWRALLDRALLGGRTGEHPRVDEPPQPPTDGQPGPLSGGHRAPPVVQERATDVPPLPSRPVNPLDRRGRAPYEQRPAAPLDQRTPPPAEQRQPSAYRPANPLGQRPVNPLEQRPVNPLEQRSADPPGQRGEPIREPRPVNPLDRRVRPFDSYAGRAAPVGNGQQDPPHTFFNPAPRPAGPPVYPGAESAPARPAYPPEPTYPVPPAAPTRPGYPAEPGFAAEPGYVAEPGYAAESGYAAGSGFPADSRHPADPAYPAPLPRGESAYRAGSAVAHVAPPSVPTVPGPNGGLAGHTAPATATPRPDRPAEVDLLAAAVATPTRPAGSPGVGDGEYPARIEWRQSRSNEETDRAVSVLRRAIGGPRVLAFANPKGGVHKTTATVLAAASIGSVRGRGVLAWDDNELRGTLGLRAGSARHARTIRHLITDLASLENLHGDDLTDRLDDYLRHASDGSYDVLAGEENPRFAQRLDHNTVRRIMDLLRRTHDVICVDTGNNVESVNWQTVLQTADQLVVTTVPREDAAFTADWMLDLLHEIGMGELASNAITLLSCPTPAPGSLLKDLTRHFATRTRAVAVVPYDAALETGSSIEYAQLQPATREAWLKASSTMLEPFAH